MKPKRLHLVPEEGIEFVDGQTIALTCPAWLRIEPLAELVHRKWIRLHYSLSFYDDPVRPLIRFVTRNGDIVIQPMNGPILGSAEWIGRIPDGTTAISVSPVARPGRFAFRLNSVSSVWRANLASKGFWRNPHWLLWAMRSRLVNSRREEWQAASFATSGMPVSHYTQWRARFDRPLEIDGLDSPRTDWRIGPVFRLLLRLKGDSDSAQLNCTIRSLRHQVYPQWSLSAVSDATTTDALLAAFRSQAANDMRLLQVSLGDNSTIGKFSADDFVALIDIGDQLPSHALALLSEAVSRQPELKFVYTDEDYIAAPNNSEYPILKPDWSPVFQQYTGYIGRLAFFRFQHLGYKRLYSLICNEEATCNDLVDNIPRSQIHHLRRVLYLRQASITRAPADSTLPPNVIKAEPITWPKVTIVIPTRDNAKLLAGCLHGLHTKTDYPSIETIVVDNGSSDRAAVRLLQEAAATSHTMALQRPGPFNFSALSNDGARAGNGSVLIFLNNDVSMLERNWLKALVRWAIKPQVGVVGAKLLFPSGKIQHAESCSVLAVLLDIYIGGCRKITGDIWRG